MSQQELALPETPLQIDLSKFVEFRPAIEPVLYSVNPGGGGRRSGEVGRCVGVIGFKHTGGYEVLLRFADDKIESFNAFNLFPV